LIHHTCQDCISSKHNKHNFEPVEKILPEKLDELKGAEARYSKDLTPHLASLIWNSLTFARHRVKSLLYLASAPLSSSNFSGRIFSTGSKLCLLCLDEIQS
jgi:hypothetical protein